MLDKMMHHDHEVFTSNRVLVKPCVQLLEINCMHMLNPECLSGR